MRLLGAFFIGFIANKQHTLLALDVRKGFKAFLAMKELYYLRLAKASFLQTVLLIRHHHKVFNFT